MQTTYNPFDPRQVDDQDALLPEVRRSCPVAEVMPGVFLLTRHEDLVAASIDPVTYPQAPFRPLEEGPRDPDTLQLGESNPPHHTALRKLMLGLVNPRRVRAMEPFIAEVAGRLATDLADALARDGRADLTAVVARPLPAAVVGRLTGVPDEAHGMLHEYSDLIVDSVQLPELEPAAAARLAELDAYFLDVIRRRRAASDRPDDAMTALIEGTGEGGRPLDDAKILLHLTRDFIAGGIDTTTHLVGNLFHDLLSTPGAYPRVRDDRALVPVAIEESLRRRPIVNVLFRRPEQDVTVRDVTIPGGSTVVLCYAAANRDETVYDDPDGFRLDRPADAPHHLGFGWGTHLCIGSTLARVEVRHQLDAVLDRVPEMRLDPAFDYQRIEPFMMRGPRRLDVLAGAGA